MKNKKGIIIVIILAIVIVVSTISIMLYKGIEYTKYQQIAYKQYIEEDLRQARIYNSTFAENEEEFLKKIESFPEKDKTIAKAIYEIKPKVARIKQFKNESKKMEELKAIKATCNEIIAKNSPNLEYQDTITTNGIKTGIDYLIPEEIINQPIINEEQESSQSGRISLFDIETYTYIDYDEDVNNKSYFSYNATDKRFKVLRISRIQPKNKEEYPELLYVYRITGPGIMGEITSKEYAYVSLDSLLTDISWTGEKYSYLTPPNTYEIGFEYEQSAPSPINGISQSEYNAIKNGEFPNIKITE